MTPSSAPALARRASAEMRGTRPPADLPTLRVGPLRPGGDSANEMTTAHIVRRDARHYQQPTEVLRNGTVRGSGQRRGPRAGRADPYRGGGRQGTDSIEHEVSTARASAQAQAERLRNKADASEAKVADKWGDIQQSFNGHIAKAREGIDTKRAERDVKKAKRRAEDAENYAALAIDLAYSAVVEAEYAVLDAELARMDAEQVQEERGHVAASRAKA